MLVGGKVSKKYYSRGGGLGQIAFSFLCYYVKHIILIRTNG